MGYGIAFQINYIKDGIFKLLRNRFPGINSASLCSLAGPYDNPIHTQFLGPIDCSKIPAHTSETVRQEKGDNGKHVQSRRFYFLFLAASVLPTTI